jgi:hypothetical protein
MSIEAVNGISQLQQKTFETIKKRRGFGLHHIFGQKKLPDTLTLTAKTAARQGGWQLLKAGFWGSFLAIGTKNTLSFGFSLIGTPLTILSAFMTYNRLSEFAILKYGKTLASIFSGGKIKA